HHPPPIRRPPPPSTLFPYTTLFRSGAVTPNTKPQSDIYINLHRQQSKLLETSKISSDSNLSQSSKVPADQAVRNQYRTSTKSTRSEEHTSELQSRENLVCRLLLEKK